MTLTPSRSAQDQVLSCEDCEADDTPPSLLDRAAVRVSDIITSPAIVSCTHTVVPRGLRRALVTVFTAATHTLAATATGRKPS